MRGPVDTLLGDWTRNHPAASRRLARKLGCDPLGARRSTAARELAQGQRTFINLTARSSTATLCDNTTSWLIPIALLSWIIRAAPIHTLSISVLGTAQRRYARRLPAEEVVTTLHTGF